MTQILKQSRWSPDEIEFIRQGFLDGMPVKVLAQMLGRSPTALNKALSRFRIRSTKGLSCYVPALNRRSFINKQVLAEHALQASTAARQAFTAERHTTTAARHAHSAARQTSTASTARRQSSTAAQQTSTARRQTSTAVRSFTEQQASTARRAYSKRILGQEPSTHSNKPSNNRNRSRNRNRKRRSIYPRATATPLTKVLTSISWIIQYLNTQGYNVSQKTLRVGLRDVTMYFLNERPVTSVRLLLIANSLRLAQDTPILAIETNGYDLSENVGCLT
ncbi:MAG: hypothetical protein LBR89_04155 [Holosporales bacterium]|jgi:hypothetical protein|nr:hypothetical protein [Holosporales bacterium]